MLRTFTALLVLLAGFVLPGTRAAADCPPSCPAKGGGSAKQDCHAEFASTALRLNYPHFDPAKPKPAKELRCFDGDPGCDTDGAVNNECVFPIDVCLLTNPDPFVPACAPATVTAVTVPNPKANSDLQALQAALGALLPPSGDACTTGQVLHVALKGPDAKGRFKKVTATVKVKAATASGTDANHLKLTCLPHGWPSHGFDHDNTRATPLETIISPANVATLVPKWQTDFQTLEGGSSNGVTATPTVGNGLVYASSWNGKVYALNASTGAVKWRYDTGSAGVLGVQGTPTLTADGRVLVGDSLAQVHCLDGKTGKLLWKQVVGGAADHVWGGITVANGRAFVGIASHNDTPCTQGRVVALDVDTGTPLWTHVMVPDEICDNDTTIACTSDADCGGGTCVPSRGAGVTATVAVDATGNDVYVDTVGCFTFPSNGDEDSILKLDASTGNTTWKRRVQPPESFKVCQGDGAIACVADADCGANAPCVAKSFYHDFGFLNGPILASDGTQPLVVSGSKDGSLYALDPATGAPVWTRAVEPSPVTPAFAGFGLFDGAVGFANNRFYAALYDFIPALASPPNHLMAFDATNGTTAWQDDIGKSWGSIAVANGVVFTGTNVVAEYYAYDAATGARLKTFTVPTTISSGASIVDGTVYVGYGIIGPAGGVLAYALP